MAAWIHLIYYSMMPFIPRVIVIFLDIEILWLFLTLLSVHRFCSFLFRTPTWLNGFIRYFIAWWPSLWWNLSVWILKQMKMGDFTAVFLTFQLNIDYVHHNLEFLHGWLDLSDISKHDDLYLRDETCLFGFWKKWKLKAIFSYISTVQRFRTSHLDNKM